MPTPISDKDIIQRMNDMAHNPSRYGIESGQIIGAEQVRDMLEEERKVISLSNGSDRTLADNINRVGKDPKAYGFSTNEEIPIGKFTAKNLKEQNERANNQGPQKQ